MWRIKRLDPSEYARWDAFVEHSPKGTFFHLTGWKRAIDEVFGHTTHYLFAEREDEIQGVLPLANVKSILFGNSLVSVPFAVYGGIVAEAEDAFDLLREEALRLAGELGVDYLELRNRECPQGNPPAKDLYVTFRKGISSDPEENLKSIPRKQRAMVRKGIDAGLDSRFETETDNFYDLYSTSVRNLGTPVLPRKWFAGLKRIFGERCEILTVRHGEQSLSSVMSFRFRDEILPYYGGGGALARRYKANDFMYWEVLRIAGERGCRTFDYGRSKKGTGSYSFKKNWGFEPVPLHYDYHLVKADTIPDINPLNPKYRMFVNMWRRMPLSLSRITGPLLSRYLA